MKNGTVLGWTLGIGAVLFFVFRSKPSTSSAPKSYSVTNFFGQKVVATPGITKNAAGNLIAADVWTKVHGFPSLPSWNPVIGPAKSLPADAKPVWDQYTKEVYPRPGQLAVDEYGRGPGGYGGGFDFGPLVAISQQVLPWIPGVGPEAAAAVAVAVAIGQGKSLQDAAIAGARAALPPEAQIAFDAGVGVASGQSVPTAAIQTMVNRVPGGLAAYQKGQSMVHK